jgi:hypothetical protein
MSRVPLRSTRYPDARSTEAARDHFYVDELDRQADLASRGFGDAVLAFAQGADENVVWARLQGGVFAAILVERLLKPARVLKAYPQHESQADSQRFADARGRRLRGLLDVPDDSPLLRVHGVRNAFEHFDAGIDCAVRPEVFCVSDWYVSDSELAASAESDDGAVALALRSFAVTAGLLRYDDEVLDIFELDEALQLLRVAVASVRPQLSAEIVGRGMFGGVRLAQIEPVEARRRLMTWLSMRSERGVPVPISITDG